MRENSPASPSKRSQTGPMEQDWASSLISMTTISGLFSPVPMEEMGPKYERKKDGAWIGLVIVTVLEPGENCHYNKLFIYQIILIEALSHQVHNQN